MVNNSVSCGKKMCSVSQQSLGLSCSSCGISLGWLDALFQKNRHPFRPPPPQWKAQYFYPLFHPDFQNLLMSPPFPQYFQVQGDLTPPLPSRLLDAIIFIAEDSFR